MHPIYTTTLQVSKSNSCGRVGSAQSCGVECAATRGCNYFAFDGRSGNVEGLCYLLDHLPLEATAPSITAAVPAPLAVPTLNWTLSNGHEWTSGYPTATLRPKVIVSPPELVLRETMLEDAPLHPLHPLQGGTLTPGTQGQQEGQQDGRQEGQVSTQTTYDTKETTTESSNGTKGASGASGEGRNAGPQNLNLRRRRSLESTAGSSSLASLATAGTDATNGNVKTLSGSFTLRLTKRPSRGQVNGFILYNVTVNITTFTLNEAFKTRTGEEDHINASCEPILYTV